MAGILLRLYFLKVWSSVVWFLSSLPNKYAVLIFVTHKHTPLPHTQNLGIKNKYVLPYRSWSLYTSAMWLCLVNVPIPSFAFTLLHYSLYACFTLEMCEQQEITAHEAYTQGITMWLLTTFQSVTLLKWKEPDRGATWGKFKRHMEEDNHGNRWESMAKFLSKSKMPYDMTAQWQEERDVFSSTFLHPLSTTQSVW